MINKSQNLVPNNSFETYTLCPTNSCNIETYSAFWTAASVVSSTDYFNTCSVSCKLPTQFARTGNGHAGFIFLGASSSIPDQREYLQIQLTNPLVNNKTYFVEFFVLLRDLSIISGCNNIAANFSVGRPYTSTAFLLQQLPAHIINPGNPIINDKINWVQISGCYTAQGGEEYLTIGNFFDDANTQTTGTGSSPQSYYLIDDVRVEEMTSVCVTGLRDLSYLSEFVGVSPNPSTNIVTVTSQYNLEKIELLSITGQVLLSESINSKTHQLQLQNFAEGIYFVRVIYPNGLSTVKKVIVNR